MAILRRNRNKRIGDVQRLPNIKPKPAAAKHYNLVRLQLPDGEETVAAFTDHELTRAIARGKKNPEDTARMKVGRVRDWLD